MWSTAVKKSGKWYRVILEEVERSMGRWHEAEVELSRQRRPSAVGVGQGGGGVYSIGEMYSTSCMALVV